MEPGEIKVKDVMTKDVVVAKLGDTISKAISKMQEHGFHELPVVNDRGELVGYVNYRTLIRRKSLSLYSRVENIMVKPPVLDPDASIEDAVKLMIDAGYRSLPIVEKNKLVGIISRTDIIKLVPKMKDVANIPVEDVMTSEPELVEEDSPIQYAVDIMKKLGEMSVPVVDENRKLVGIVHMRDAAKAVWREKERASLGEVSGEKKKVQILVKEIMVPPVYVSEDSILKDAVEKMIEFHSSICAVIDKKSVPIGVISQRDVIEAILREGKQEGVFVQITGLDIEDMEPYQIIYNMVEEFLHKINRFKEFKPQLLTFHVEEHHISGKEIKYSVRARLTTDRRLFFARSYDWNIYSAFKDVLEILERNVKKERDKLLEFRRETL
ncbi:CBS domain-containing protein [Candidatus Aciduliprofundum boonei]|uniref:CBS domain containing membrane protein n=1 Tax=Aciduliprofundum boonei (strain DSM 19572 / T469) TaxID=439481 RepID=B5ICG6_ACIB4|nr:CBS domain-containing protein [Candidatus Aciduliprofundum boonei]ADD09042.1 CBS domain containing membrane protein [Aciduliprofundum boonei T469]EDY36063.1 CBS domain pair protein [Aciduliprofundum boonei T469]HII54443.1 CBS domain-containing protein [Candidatus Aciduliprofundum boonei]